MLMLYLSSPVGWAVQAGFKHVIHIHYSIKFSCMFINWLIGCKGKEHEVLIVATLNIEPCAADV